MKFIQAKHPAVCWPLLPWFVEGDQTREEIFMELYGRLEQDPENTFVEIALDGDICKGVLIAYNFSNSNDAIWIWQARAAKGFRYQKDMFSHLKEWSKNKNKKVMRMETHNDKLEKLYSRKFGFTKNGDVMECAV